MKLKRYIITDEAKADRVSVDRKNNLMFAHQRCIVPETQRVDVVAGDQTKRCPSDGNHGRARCAFCEEIFTASHRGDRDRVVMAKGCLSRRL